MPGLQITVSSHTKQEHGVHICAQRNVHMGVCEFACSIASSTYTRAYDLVYRILLKIVRLFRHDPGELYVVRVYYIRNVSRALEL